MDMLRLGAADLLYGLGGNDPLFGGRGRDRPSLSGTAATRTLV